MPGPTYDLRIFVEMFFLAWYLPVHSKLISGVGTMSCLGRSTAALPPLAASPGHGGPRRGPTRDFTGPLCPVALRADGRACIIQRCVRIQSMTLLKLYLPVPVASGCTDTHTYQRVKGKGEGYVNKKRGRPAGGGPKSKGCRLKAARWKTARGERK